MVSFGSNTRSIFAGGAAPTTNRMIRIQFVTIASTGNAKILVIYLKSKEKSWWDSNETRGITAGGANAGPRHNI